MDQEPQEGASEAQPLCPPLLLLGTFSHQSQKPDNRTLWRQSKQRSHESCEVVQESEGTSRKVFILAVYFGPGFYQTV